MVEVDRFSILTQDNKTLMDELDKGMFVIAMEQDALSPGKLSAKKNYLASRLQEEKGRSYQFNQLRAEAKENYYQWLF